jgi:hypothetical protein
LLLCTDHYASTGLKRYNEWLELGPEEVALRVGELRELAWMRLESPDGLSAAELVAAREAAEAEAREVWRSEEHRQENLRRREEAAADLERRGLVYFIRINDLIKIGKSLRFEQRLTSFSYPGIKVLATEPGYSIREANLHRQFSSYRHSGEWFRAAQPLLDYIATLTPYAPPKPGRPYGRVKEKRNESRLRYL